MLQHLTKFFSFIGHSSQTNKQISPAVIILKLLYFRKNDCWKTEVLLI